MDIVGNEDSKDMREKSEWLMKQFPQDSGKIPRTMARYGAEGDPCAPHSVDGEQGQEES